MTERKFKNNRGRNKQIGGDQNVIQGSISGGVIVQGRGANVAVQQSSGINEEQLSLVFEKMYQAI